MPFDNEKAEHTYMLVPCEVAVKCVLPVVRAMIAKELVAKHGSNQVETARLLGVSQSAISLYSRKARGNAINLENDRDVAVLVAGLTDLLAEGKLSHWEFISMFCEVCCTIRAKGLMCKLHKAFDPTIDIDECELCAIEIPKSL